MLFGPELADREVISALTPDLLGVHGIGIIERLEARGGGFIEAIIWCLMSDARFDARFNPGLKREQPSGWGPVLVASFTLLIGTVAFMFGIAMIVIYIWTALGWLDGLNIKG